MGGQTCHRNANFGERTLPDAPIPGRDTRGIHTSGRKARGNPSARPCPSQGCLVQERCHGRHGLWRDCPRPNRSAKRARRPEPHPPKRWMHVAAGWPGDHGTGASRCRTRQTIRQTRQRLQAGSGPARRSTGRPHGSQPDADPDLPMRQAWLAMRVNTRMRRTGSARSTARGAPDARPALHDAGMVQPIIVANTCKAHDGGWPWGPAAMPAPIQCRPPFRYCAPHPTRAEPRRASGRRPYRWSRSNRPKRASPAPRASAPGP